ncbi:putative secretion protein SecE [Pseudomonas paraeruginosa]|uniref:Secretion protein SecE n=1 Tax=Pseudomonas paraeruginosa TaxID=2994495 RepID=A0A2R3IY10_9PSED|nr:putative secretion protein SecE [Pseudomonas paraeruginosa]AWE91938.1 putative secretion protein SecE [Pseudomonas paraeruginosa]
MQRQESSDHRQNENTENAIQDWLSRKVLVTYDGNHNQNGNQEPFQEIKT